MAIEREHHTSGRSADPASVMPALPMPAGVVSPLARRPVAGPLQLPGAARVIVMPDVPAAPGTASLLPLLALWLAREGVAVLVHRPGALEGPGSAVAVLGSLGIAPARGAADVADRWARREPAVVATGLIVPAGRAALAHWPLVTPRGPRQVLHVVRCDDGATEQQAAAWAAHHRAAALLLAGPFGIDAHHGPRVEVWLEGRRHPALGSAAADEPPAHRSPMPRDTSAAATAVFAQQVLSGERPAPGPMQALAQRILATWALLG